MVTSLIKDCRDMSHFGDWLKTVREERGWGQAQVADRAGTSIPTISRLETGERGPSRKLAAKIAIALGADPDHALKALMADTPGVESSEITRSLTDEEWALIENYRGIKPDMRELYAKLIANSVPTKDGKEPHPDDVPLTEYP